jgi:hypothetical protein
MSDLRDDLMATYTSMNEGEDQNTNDPVLETNDEPKQQELDLGAEDTGTEQQPTQRERDASGKFAPKTPAKDEIPADQKQGTEEAKTDATQQQAAPQNKAPVSWKPEEREGWDKMSPHHQQAIQRREREISQTLAQTSEMRTFATNVAKTMQPYIPMIQAAGSNPIEAIAETMKTAAFIRTAPAPQRAAAIADLIFTHGIDIGMLDQAIQNRLNGGQQYRPHAQNDPMMQMLEQKLAPVQQFMTEIQQRRDQQTQQITSQAQQSIEQFAADPKNEFFEDVREDVADLLELAANRGQQLDLPTAYTRATLAHPTIGPLLQRRQAQQTATQHTAAAQRARNAAVSPSGDGAPSQSGSDEEGDDIRSAVLASMKQLQNRR